MIHGVLNVYKERGYTSHDVVARLRGILHQKKIGHTGTLDPEAEGVLPVCLGAGTRLCDMLTEKDKVYRAVLLLGVTTDTQDITGEVLSRTEEMPDKEAVRRAAASFIGPYDQVPPMYCALKVNGKRLYELAREGKTVERKARRVQIFDLSIEQIDLPRVTMTVTCSRGTYIRTLCHDIGALLGCGGCMEALTRTRSGIFREEGALRLEEIADLEKAGRLQEHILPIERMFEQYPAFCTRPEADRLLCNGNALRAEHLQEAAREKESAIQSAAPEEGGQETPRVRMRDSAGRFLGLYEYRAQTGEYRPVKMFLTGEDV